MKTSEGGVLRRVSGLWNLLEESKEEIYYISRHLCCQINREAVYKDPVTLSGTPTHTKQIGGWEGGRKKAVQPGPGECSPIPTPETAKQEKGKARAPLIGLKPETTQNMDKEDAPKTNSSA